MTTRAEAIAAAGRCIAAGIMLRDSLPPMEAAKLAVRAGGPTVEEIARQINDMRADAGWPGYTKTPAVADGQDAAPTQGGRSPMPSSSWSGIGDHRT